MIHSPNRSINSIKFIDELILYRAYLPVYSIGLTDFILHCMSGFDRENALRTNKYEMEFHIWTKVIDICSKHDQYEHPAD